MQSKGEFTNCFGVECKLDHYTDIHERKKINKQKEAVMDQKMGEGQE